MGNFKALTMTKRALWVFLLIGVWLLLVMIVTAGDGLPGVEDAQRYPNLHPIRWRVLLSIGPIIMVGGLIWIWRAEEH